MRYDSSKLPTAWLSQLLLDVKGPFSMLAARTKKPSSDQTKMEGLDQIEFVYEEGCQQSPSVGFEIAFGKEMRERFTPECFNALTNTFKRVLESGRAFALKPSNVAVEVEIICQ